jgi:alpha-glucosidase
VAVSQQVDEPLARLGSLSVVKATSSGDWDSSASAGFTCGMPWLPVGEHAQTGNIAQMSRDPTSILTLYRRLIDLRRTHHALSIGALSALEVVGNVLAYQRSYGPDRFAVLLNFGHEPGSPTAAGSTGQRTPVNPP